MWQKSTLGNSCQMYQPKTISAKEMVPDGEYDVFGANGIIGKYNHYNHAEPQLLVTCRGATCGAVNVSKPFSWINGNAMVIKPDLNKISLKYMEYLFRGGIDLTKAITGAAQPQITRQSLESIEFYYPSLAEQQHIVAKLDSAFAEINSVIETTKKNFENISRIFSVILDGWVNKNDFAKEILLGEVCKLSQGLAINKSTKHLLVDKSSQPLLRIKDLISKKFEQYVDDSYQNVKTRVNKEDIIFTRTGSLGLTFRGMEGVLHNNSFKVEPNESLNSDYLFWWLKNPSFLKKIHTIAAKAAQPDISHKLFSSQSIRLPTLKKQTEIVNKIEKLFPIIQSLEKLYQNKLENFVSLKSAILTQLLQSKFA